MGTKKAEKSCKISPFLARFPWNRAL